MNIWSDVKLKDISKKITKGTTPTTLGYNFSEKGVNFIKAESISKDGLINKNTFSFIDKKTHDALKRSQIEENDILVTIAGIYLGKIGYVKKEHTPANTNQAVAIVRLNQEKAIPKYVKYFLLEKSTNHFLNSLCPQTAQPNLNLTELGNLKFPLPPLPIQKKIAAVLSAYDYLIENNNCRIAILEKMAEEIYREWFVRMRFPGHEKVKFHKGVPEGWEIKELKDTQISIIDGDRGKNYPKKEEFDSLGYCLFLNTGNIQNDAFNFTKCDFITKKKDSLLRKGRLIINDIVLTTRGTVGSVAFYNKNLLFKNIRINSGMVILRLKQGNNNSLYYYYLLKSPLLKEQYKLYSSGAAPPQLPIKDLKRINVLIPSEKIINNFCNFIESFNTQIERLRAVNNNLTTSRNLLLSRLISGKLSVEGLDIKFPPSMEETDA